MSKYLSILKSDERIDVDTNRSDVASATLKGIIGAAPLVGPILAEALGIAIPNQKLDRLIIFASVLDDKIKYLKEDTVKLKMETEEFRDLLEDGLIQATRQM